MKRSRKIFGRVVSTLLLLVFSVAIVPLDFLHTHASRPVCSISAAEAGTSCKHKLHISKKGSFCLICGVHQDKAFTKSDLNVATFLPIRKFAFLNFNEGRVHSAVPYYSLRGPPVHLNLCFS